MRGVFVTGTGTGVGKTVVAAVISRELSAGGSSVAVFKPALTGLEDEGEPDHELLRRASETTQSDEEIAPYRFDPPLSPHLAAELAGVEIDPDRLIRVARRAASGADAIVCEGVGGLLVPLRRDYLVRDLARDLSLPLVVVAAPGLGTINHTLLTLEVARRADLEIAGVVLTPWPEPPGRIERSNLETIRDLGEVPVVTLAPLDLRNPASWPPLGPEQPAVLAGLRSQLAG